MTRIGAIACLFIALAGAAHAQTASETQDLISALALPADAKISFVDIDGSPIGYGEFMQKANVDKLSFSVDKDLKAHTATLRLISAKKAAEPAGPALKVHPGDPVPAFALDTAQGRHLTNASLAGHYTLLSFYFADCVPCIAEVPALNKLAARGDALQVLPVTYEPRATAEVFAKQRKLRLDSLVNAQTLIDAIGVTTYPTLVLVDPHGRVAAAAISTSLAKRGSPDADDLAHWIDQHQAR